MPNRSRTARRLRDAFPAEDLELCQQPVGDTRAWRTLRGSAFEYFLERNTELAATYSLGRWTSYFWDMEAATITFSDDEQPRVVANIEFAGSYARVPETWMWSWANPSYSDPVTRRVQKVRDYGKTHNLSMLYSDLWHATETHALEMTAVTAFLLRGRGAYRVPSDMPGTTIYMVIMDAQWVG